jgi:hypothetical protein
MSGEARAGRDVRFDHAVIAVRDLAYAIEQFRGAGFVVQRGGRHTGFGTENAIIRFGLDYIELIGVYDAGEARTRSARGAVLVRLLDEVPVAFVGFALAASDLPGILDDILAAGFPAPLLSDMQRLRPDGSKLDWQLLIPGEVAWRRPWPFFINWGASDAERLSLERPGAHALPVTGVAGVTIAVRDLDATVRLYQAALGVGPIDCVANERARFAVGNVIIDVLRDEMRRPDAVGEGMSGLALRVRAEARSSAPSTIAPMLGLSIALVA